MGVDPPVPKHSIIRLVAVAASVLTFSTGCIAVSGSVDGPSVGRRTPGGGLGRTGPVATGEANEVVQRALKDVERFWSATYPTLSGGDAFRPVKGGYHPYTRSDPPPACGQEQGEYQPNAFYCPVGDFIAWDAETLIPQLNANFGPLLVGVVMAHEYGHAIQPRLGRSREATIVLEQQADCFAGAWVGDVMAGRSQAYRDIQPEQLDSTVAGLLTLRDQPGTSATSEQAHGNAFDRVRAFQEGIELDATRCARYRADNLPVTEVAFTGEDDAARGGNLPYDDAVDLLSRSIQVYWERTFPKLADGRNWEPLRVTEFDPASPPDCEGLDTSAEVPSAFYCASGDFVAFDGRELGPALHEKIGDNAVGMLLGNLFAQAAQARRGVSTQGRDGQLAVDCLAGSWTHEVLHPTGSQDVELSPGDLDEAVTALLVFGRSAKSGDASAFDRIAKFRSGVLQGLPACSG
jgi:predicted metalloprotease